MIEKEGGGERPLRIPTIRDRVAQTAAKLTLEPIFEADLEPNAYGYLPKRSAGDAIQEVDRLLYEGYTDVVDADLSKFLDRVPYCPWLLKKLWLLVDHSDSQAFIPALPHEQRLAAPAAQCATAVPH